MDNNSLEWKLGMVPKYETYGRLSFKDIFELIPKTREFHSTDSQFYKMFDEMIGEYFNAINNEIIDLFPFGTFKWPRISLGNIDSYNFFSLSEIILYSFYFHNRNKYDIVFDIGGNIGIDTIILGKIGYKVYSFEPDIEVFNIMQKNVLLNDLANINLYPKALSNKRGEVNFIRIKGNTTSSHIEGEKESYYGEIDKIQVKTITFDDIGVIPSLMKINIEGHETSLVPSIAPKVWETCDAFIELHGEKSCKIILEYFTSIGVNVFSQKIGWGKVKNMYELPVTYKEGCIFVSKKNCMPW